MKLLVPALAPKQSRDQVSDLHVDLGYAQNACGRLERLPRSESNFENGIVSCVCAVHHRGAAGATKETKSKNKKALLTPIPDFHTINLSDIDRTDETFRFRSSLDVSALKNNIREQGQIVPIIVRLRDDGKYQIIAGFRRTTAMSQLRSKTIECDVREVDDREALIISFAENQLRDSLSSYDLVMSAKRLKESNEYTVSEIAQLMSVNRRTIQRYIKVANAPKLLLDALINQDITIMQIHEGLQARLTPKSILGHIKRGRSVSYLRKLAKEHSAKRSPDKPEKAVRIAKTHKGTLVVAAKIPNAKKKDVDELITHLRDMKKKLPR